jgi:hypothetical protein
MPANPQRESATIYQFPVGGRQAAGGRRAEAKAAAPAEAPRVAKAICGSGWYHEAAIQEADQAFRR